MKRLLSRNQARGELPLGTLALALLDDEIKSLVQLAIQSPHIILLIRLGPPRHRSLHGDPVLIRQDLTIITNPLLGIQQQLLHNSLGVARRAAHQHLIVPRHSSMGVIPPDILSGDTATFLQLDLPVQLGRRVFLEIHGRSEPRLQPLVEPLLVEVERRLEGRGQLGQERGAGEDNSRLDAVARGRGGGRGIEGIDGGRGLLLLLRAGCFR